jgi:hypothetical protein
MGEDDLKRRQARRQAHSAASARAYLGASLNEGRLRFQSSKRPSSKTSPRKSEPSLRIDVVEIGGNGGQRRRRLLNDGRAEGRYSAMAVSHIKVLV